MDTRRFRPRDLDESDVLADARRMEDETWWREQVVARVKAEEDPAERQRLAKDALEQARFLVQQLSEVRAESVRRLHEQHGSWRATGEAMGTTGQNAYKVALRVKGSESI